MPHRTASEPIDLAAIEASLARAEAAITGELPATVETVGHLVNASIAARRLADALDPPETVAGRTTATDFGRLSTMAVIAEEILGPDHRTVVLLRRALASRDEVDLQFAQEDLLDLPRKALRQIAGLLQATEADEGGAQS